MMPAPSWEDVSAFLSTDEFAVSATIGFQAGGSRDVVGIFDDPYLDAALGEYVLDSSKPRLTCAQAAVAGARRGDTVTIDGAVFDVLSAPQSDGTGLALLDLARRLA